MGKNREDEKMRRRILVGMLWVCLILGTIPANSTQEKFKVLYDGYHSIYGASFFNPFNSRLPDQFIVEYTYEPLTEEGLSGCDMLGIAHPIVAYSAEEIYHIKKFVERGGGLLAMGTGWAYVDYFHNPIEDYPLNQIAREFGVSMNDDFITDPTNYHTLGGVNYPVFTNFAVHPVSVGLSAVYAGWPSSFTIAGNAVPIVRGDEDAYSANYHHPVYEAGDFPPIAVASEYNKGRVIFCGNDGFVHVCLDDYDNLKFGLNMFYWLAGGSSGNTECQHMLDILNWNYDFYNRYLSGCSDCDPGTDPTKDFIEDVDTDDVPIAERDIWMYSFPQYLNLGTNLGIDTNTWYDPSPDRPQLEIEISNFIDSINPFLKEEELDFIQKFFFTAGFDGHYLRSPIEWNEKDERSEIKAILAATFRGSGKDLQGKAIGTWYYDKDTYQIKEGPFEYFSIQGNFGWNLLQKKGQN
jgi:hypothetical protein